MLKSMHFGHKSTVLMRILLQIRPFLGLFAGFIGLEWAFIACNAGLIGPTTVHTRPRGLGPQGLVLGSLGVKIRYKWARRAHGYHMF